VKKLLTLFLAIGILAMPICGMNVAGNDEFAFDELKTLGIIDDNSFKGEYGYITRQECLVSITKAIGMTEEANRYFCELNYYRPAFNDVALDVEIGGGYVWGAEGTIALGDGNQHFFPNHTATYKEAVAFMMRCLEQCPPDLDIMLSRAIEIGLIRETDHFYENMDAYFYKQDFCVLLERLIGQNRFAYFADYYLYEGEKYYEGSWEYNEDESRSITYREFLIAQQSDVGEIV